MKIKNYLFLILGSLICALSFNILLTPYNIIAGGVSGITTILSKYLAIDSGLLMLIIAGIMLLLGLLLLGFNKVKDTIIGTLLFPLMVFVVNLVLGQFHLTLSNVLLSSIFGGISFGFGLGIAYKYGFNLEGLEILTRIVNKYFKINYKLCHYIITVLLIVSTFFLGINGLMYSVVALYLSSIVIDRVIIGISNCKSFHIITSKPNEVSDYILNKLHHGVTIINGKGAYSDENKNILMTVIPTRDYYKLKEGIKNIDNEAFFVVCDSYEVNGGI